MRTYYKAISLIELLTALAVIVIAIYFISPIIFHLPEPIILNNEVEQVRSFFYTVQTKARYSQKSYTISLNQDKQQWCMIAVAKNDENHIPCNCLHIESCHLHSHYFLYQPHTKYVQLASKKFFPNIFMRINSDTGGVESVCLRLFIHKYEQVLQFNTTGVMNVIQKGKRSQCSSSI